MAVVQVRKSDVSGREIPAQSGARVRVMWNDPSKTDMRADFTDEEVEKILGKYLQPVEGRPKRKGERRIRL